MDMVRVSVVDSTQTPLTLPGGAFLDVSRSVQEQPWHAFSESAHGNEEGTNWAALLSDKEKLKSFLEDKPALLEKALDQAIWQGAVEVVDLLLEKRPTISPRAFHLARQVENKAVLTLLDEVAPFYREEKEAFDKQDFKEFLQYMAGAKSLNLSKHCEITADYFSFAHAASILPSLEKLNLNRCLGITDKDLEVIAQSFPRLQEINLSLERRYEDLELVIGGDSCLSYCRRAPSQGIITKVGLGYLAKGCVHLKELSLASRFLLGNEIREILGDPDLFTSLQFLDLSDCYLITQDTLRKIQEAHPLIQIKKDRVFSAFTFSEHLKATEKNIDIPLCSSKVLQMLYQALEEENVEAALAALRNEEGAKEDSDQDLTLEKVLTLAAQKGDQLVVFEILKRDVVPTEDMLHVAIQYNKDPQVIRLFLETGVSLTEEAIHLAILYRKNEDILDFLLRIFYSHTEGVLNSLVKNGENNPLSIQLVLARGARCSQKTLQLAIEYNHLRTVRLLVQHGAHLYEEELNAAVRYNTPRMVEFMLEEGVRPTEETVREACRRGVLKIQKLLTPYRQVASSAISSLNKRDPFAREEYPYWFSPEGKETLSSDEKKAIIRYGSLENVKKLLDRETIWTEDLLNAAIQRDSYTVVQMLLDKGARPSFLSYKISQCNRSLCILELLKEHLSPKIAVEPLTSELFFQLLPFWKEKKQVNLSGWQALTDECFRVDYQLSGKLPAVTQLQLDGCIHLGDQTLKHLAENFPKLESLDISGHEFSSQEKRGPFSKEGVEYLKSCVRLRWLFLRFRNDLAPALEKLLSNPANLPHLKVLDLTGWESQAIQAILKQERQLHVID